MANELQAPPEANAVVPPNGVPSVEVPNPPTPSVANLVSGIITDAQQLIQQQFAMFRQEIRADVRKAKEGALFLALGIGIVVAGSILLLLMLPLGLHAVMPGLPLWACFGLVGGPLAVLGGIVVYVSVKKLESFDPLSDQSAAGLKENWQWTSNQK